MGYRICSIDVGTSGVRLSIYSEDLALERRIEEPNPVKASSGVVEQDPGRLLGLVRGMIGKAARESCCCLGISLYRGSVVAWSRGEARSGIVTWMDSRGVSEFEGLPLYARLASGIPLLGKALKPGSPALFIRMLSRLYPGSRVWSIDGFLLDVLTGEFMSDVSQATLTGLISPYSLKPIPGVRRLLGLQDLEIPSLQGHDSPVAVVDSVRLGPFIADQQAASIGLGCLREGCIKATLGTGMFIDAPLKGKPPLRLGDLVPLVNLSLDGRTYYGVEGFAGGVGMVFDAFSQVLGGFNSLEEAARRGGDVAPIIPVLSGLRTPYKPLLRGSVLGVSPGFTASSLARGLVVGALLLFMLIYREVTRRVGPPRVVRVGGGLSRLGVMVEGIAGLVNARVERSLDYNDSARGAALLAGYAAGVVDKRALFNPPVNVEVVEPQAHTWNLWEVLDHWMQVIDALSSRSLWTRLEEIRRSTS